MANDLEEVVEEAPQPRNIENQPIVIDEEFEAYSTPGDNEDDPDELIADGSAAIEEAPQPRNIAVGAIRRQSNSVIRNEFVVGPASEPNSARQKRNKRRKAMRKRAVARRFAERREESAETQEQEERREESAETQEQEERREESAETQEQEERREESAETQEQEEPQEAENRRHSEENNDMFAKTDCSFRDSCKVCLLAKATHLYLPCGHCCCCSDCAEVLWNQFLERRCPICRTRASEAPRRIFQPSEF
ncbi:glutamic acid-rich protein-like [Venturia canescens]|nr:glutamic acid-rich protein-like [Venturia canescens]